MKNPAYKARYEALVKQANKSINKYLLNFKNQLKVKIGEEFYPLVDYKMVEVDDQHVLRVTCGIANSPCFIDNTEFYVRSGPSTDILEGKKQHEYIQQRF
jgi:hypothetical protein